MDKFFKLEEHGTNLKTEIIAGITTFLTMAYILALSTVLLGGTGLTPGAIFFATSISAAVATIFMGVYANAPLALAPGIGLAVFFSVTVVGQFHYTAAEGLAMVFLSGVIFMIISLLGVRKYIIECIPNSLKQSISAGIGFFIAFIGLHKMGVIVADPITLVRISDFKSPTVLLAVFGLVITIIFLSMRIQAGVFLGILITAIIGVILTSLGVPNMPQAPTQLVSVTVDTSAIGLFIGGLKSILHKPETIIIVFTMLFMDFFDTAGTLLSVTNMVGEKAGKQYDMNKMFYSDALGTIVGSIFGCSNVTTYIESTSGVAAGGRTGLSSVVVGILFLLSTFFSPVLSVLKDIQVDGLFLEPVVAPALFIVGILMAAQLSYVDWHDFSSAASGFTTIIFMVLSYSIVEGMAAGFIVYVLSKVFTKERKDIHITLWVLFILFILHFTILR